MCAVIARPPKAVNPIQKKDRNNSVKEGDSFGCMTLKFSFACVLSFTKVIFGIGDYTNKHTYKRQSKKYCLN
jgi:hypothetical protein